jgi:hypothetical protein
MVMSPNKKGKPTQRAADKWDSVRFLAFFNASAGFRFRARFTSRPLAANATRWADSKTKSLRIHKEEQWE